MLRRPLLACLLALTACSSKDAPAGAPAADAGVDPLTALLGEGPAPTRVELAPACGTTGSAALKYSRRTTEWGLEGTLGNHLQALDVDHDGWPDLLVQNVNGRADATKPSARVLMNRPKPGGGRTFVDETIERGVGAIRAGTKPGDGKLRSMQLAIAADVDNDGDLDLFSGTYVDPRYPDDDTLDRNEVLLNDGTGKFKLGPKSALQGLPSELPPTTSAAFVDADRDGAIDLWVGYWYKSYGSSHLGVQARLFKGAGDGSFTDATPGSGLETQNTGYDSGKNHRPAYGVTACDLDGDGASELLVSAYGRQWNLLYKNLGAPGAAPSFEEIGQASGFAGDPIVDYSDNQFYACHCKLTGSCTPTIPAPSCGTTDNWSSVDAKPWRNNGNTFTTVCADLNGDGRLDLYSAEIKHWHIGNSSDASELLVNDGEGAIHFSRPGRPATGLAWKHLSTDWNEGGIMAAAADLDLDGREDLIVAASDYPDNWSLVYHQKEDGTFEEIGESIGLHHTCTVGLAIADFDRDGDLDVVVGSSLARDCADTWGKRNDVHLYENQLADGATKPGFLQIALEGKGLGGANKTGIGARVRVVNDGKVHTQELSGGYGHFGMQHDTALTFGLGSGCAPTAIEVRWPNGALTTARYTGVGGGRKILIKESGELVEVAK